jgi:putative ABC transport system permease protein
MLWIKLALRNARRNSRRTLLTAITVVVATALLTVTLAWMDGIFGGIMDAYTATAGHIRIVDSDFAAREELSPLYENIDPVAPVLEAIRKVPGVHYATARISTGVVITANEEIGDNFAPVLAGEDVYFRDRLRGPERLARGRWLSGKSREAVLGRRVAERIGADIGSEVLMLGQTQYGSMSPITAQVVGIAGGDTMIDEQIFIPLDEAQYLLDLPEGALEILVYGASQRPAIIGPLSDRLRSLPALEGLEVAGWYQREPWLSVIAMVSAIQAFIQFLVVFIAALAIFNTMSMSVMERTSEIGVMRAMGLSRLGALGLFIVEASSIGLLGAAFGVGIGSAGAWYLETYGITLGEGMVSKMGGSFPMTETFYADLNPGTVTTGIFLGLLIAVVGAVLPSLRAASIQPVVAMRQRR